MGVVLMEVDVALPEDSGVISDVCFVWAERESEALTPAGKVRGAPDLAVEGVSPSTRARDKCLHELRWTPDGYVIGATATAGQPFRPDALPGMNLQTALEE